MSIKAYAYSGQLELACTQIDTASGSYDNFHLVKSSRMVREHGSRHSMCLEPLQLL